MLTNRYFHTETIWTAKTIDISQQKKEKKKINEEIRKFRYMLPVFGRDQIESVELATLEAPFQMETDQFPSAFELPLKWLITMVSLLKRSLTSIARM